MIFLFNEIGGRVSTATHFSPSLPTRSPAVAERARLAATIAKVEVYCDPAAIEADWAELEAVATVSAYQKRSFLVPWIETIGASRLIAPFFVLVRDPQGHPLALLCLGIERHGPLRIASFLGGQESNFNLGLFRPNMRVTGPDLRFLLRAAAEAMGPAAPHFFFLRNQPYEWGLVVNPLALLPHQPSASFAYATRLSLDSETFLASKLSRAERKKLRKKQMRLAEFGAVTLVANDTPGEARTIIDAFLAEKIARSNAVSFKTDFSDPPVRAFLERLSMPIGSNPPWLEFHALKAGERIIATYAGAAHRGHFSCMLNSFDIDPIIAKSSPGNILLMQLVASFCDKGLRGFDLGIGEAPYKDTYCNVTLPLFDTIVPVGAIGSLCGVFAVLLLKAKRIIKRHPHIYAAARAVRQVVPGLAWL
jgi:CelD/BcsL family acetyltransferase involved in cellulose biosynthesis